MLRKMFRKIYPGRFCFSKFFLRKGPVFGIMLKILPKGREVGRMMGGGMRGGRGFMTEEEKANAPKVTKSLLKRVSAF